MDVLHSGLAPLQAPARQRQRRTTMSIPRVATAAVFLVAAFPGLPWAMDLRPETVKAWSEYVQAADRRMEGRLHAGQPYLWTDESEDRAVRVRRGEVVVAPMVGRGTREVPNGLIHDWIGAAFISRATLQSLLRVVHDYDRYKEVYRPVVADSKALACTATDQEFSMTWQRRVLFVNAAMEGRYRAHDFEVDAHRGYNVADATQVREIAEYGRPAEHLLPAGSGNGFLWSVHSIARYEERDGGVYLELEVIALTRDVPSSLRWMVNPVVNHLSINSLTTTLGQTREAVHSLSLNAEGVVACSGRGRYMATQGTPFE
jgi:hypothetical protein